MTENQPSPSDRNFLFYDTEDGVTRVQLLVDGQTVWMPQIAIAELFETSKQNVGQHIKNILVDSELSEDSVVKDYFTTAADGKKYRTKHYNLDMILAIGYRVRSSRGVQFRRWATQTLREYLVKGFVLNDDRLKAAKTTFGKDYFDELLERIRTSEAPSGVSIKRSRTSTQPRRTTAKTPMSREPFLQWCKTNLNGRLPE